MSRHLRARNRDVRSYGYSMWVLGGSRLFQNTPTTHQDVVRIGYQKTGTLNLVRLRGTLAADLARLGVQIEWIGFPAGPQLLEALNAGALDFGHTGDAPPIMAQAAGVPFVYVAHEPSPGRMKAEAIIVPAGLAAANDRRSQGQARGVEQRLERPLSTGARARVGRDTRTIRCTRCSRHRPGRPGSLLRGDRSTPGRCGTPTWPRPK